MKLVYVAGPFRASSAWDIECNIRRAEEASLAVWKMGASCICPHTNTRFFQGALPDDVWLDGDLEILKRVDAMLLVGDWRKSVGAKIEVEVASRLGIPIYESLEALESWLKEEGGK